MDRNKKILEFCPNFYKILDFTPYEDDLMSEKIIKIYQKYIFDIDVNNPDDIASVKQLDHVISKYIDDYMFRREVQKQLTRFKIRKDAKDILKEIIKIILKIFDNYEEYTTRVIYLSKWI